jgi:hypothetical protein
MPMFCVADDWPHPAIEQKEVGAGPQKRVCTIGYKTAHLPGMRGIFGEFFHKLVPCCDQFDTFFTHTGNAKTNDVNKAQGEEVPGLNLVHRGGVFKLFLRGSLNHEEEVKFCPFCGTEVKIIKVLSVILKKRIREVEDGYEEVGQEVVKPT